MKDFGKAIKMSVCTGLCAFVMFALTIFTGDNMAFANEVQQNNNNGMITITTADCSASLGL